MVSLSRTFFFCVCARLRRVPLRFLRILSNISFLLSFNDLFIVQDFEYISLIEIIKAANNFIPSKQNSISYIIWQNVLKKSSLLLVGNKYYKKSVSQTVLKG